MSGPEIRVTHGPAGRDTLAAIASELMQTAPARFESMPEIEIGQSTAGHETLAAIAEEVQREAAQIARDRGWNGDEGEEARSSVRPKMTTMSFEERPRRDSSSPEVITISEAPIGRSTMEDLERDAVADALGRGLRVSEPPRRTAQSQAAMSAPRISQKMEVFEMITFVVRANDAGRLSSMRSRKDFVAEKLMHRLPIESPDDIERVDVTPWTEKGTVILRVWCRVASD
ncbi:MAG: hypothetical protein H6716_00325 [Polyangiaceae bacterium]|nr:hypothetical protein [Polyangiaceae bacterium]